MPGPHPGQLPLLGPSRPLSSMAVIRPLKISLVISSPLTPLPLPAVQCLNLAWMTTQPPPNIPASGLTPLLTAHPGLLFF